LFVPDSVSNDLIAIRDEALRIALVAVLDFYIKPTAEAVSRDGQCVGGLFDLRKIFNLDYRCYPLKRILRHLKHHNMDCFHVFSSASADAFLEAPRLGWPTRGRNWLGGAAAALAANLHVSIVVDVISHVGKSDIDTLVERDVVLDSLLVNGDDAIDEPMWVRGVLVPDEVDDFVEVYVGLDSFLAHHLEAVEELGF
jgi:hypothetical protein